MNRGILGAVFAYHASEWKDLFVATKGASAALAGLLFVAVSINIERILALPGVPERAWETVLLLLSVLLVSIVGLIPGQSRVALGVELLGVNLAVAALLVALPRIQGAPSRVGSRLWLPMRWLARLLGPTLMTIGSLSVLIDLGGGLYWIVAGIVFAIVGAVLNAWVLLVEILR